MPGAVDFYHHLCSITHPSADSIDWLFALDAAVDAFQEGAGSRYDAAACDAAIAVCSEQGVGLIA